MNQGDKAIAQYMGNKYRLSPIHKIVYQYTPVASGKSLKEVNGVVFRTIEEEYYATEFSFAKSKKSRDIIIEPISNEYIFYYDDPNETTQDRKEIIEKMPDILHEINHYSHRHGIQYKLEFIKEESFGEKKKRKYFN